MPACALGAPMAPAADDATSVFRNPLRFICAPDEILLYSIRRCMMRNPMEKPQRLVSLDAFRGATIALMVLVNDPGDGSTAYGPLQHSEWNGWTITDVVFPF